MNTKVIYTLKIKSTGDRTMFSSIDNVEIDEIAYDKLLEDIEKRAFITIIDINQDLITIKTDTIFKIETKIEIKSDVTLKDE